MTRSRTAGSRTGRYRVAAVVVYLHVVVAAVHGLAHAAASVELAGPAHVVFLIAAVYVGPVAALRWARKGRERTAAVTLFVSMAGALAYGVAYHYVLPTPDRVSAVPDDVAGRIFRATALGIAALEGLGCFAAALLWRWKSDP